MSGAKSKYKATYPKSLIDHMSEGNSYMSFAAKIGVHRDSLYEWEKVHPEFLEAKKVAFSKSQAFWEDLGLDMAKKGNSNVWKFNMKNRFGWRENPESIDRGELAKEKGYGLAFNLSKHPDEIEVGNE